MKNTQSPKALQYGIEFTGAVGKPGKLLVKFADENIANEVFHSLKMDGYIVTICPNPAWLNITKTW